MTEPKKASKKVGEFLFDQNSSEEVLSAILLKETGISAPEEWKRAKLIQQLKANNGTPESMVAQSLEDAALDANETAEKALSDSKIDKNGMVTIKFPTHAKIKIALTETDQGDFQAGLNGVNYAIRRGEMVKVPWGLIADMTRQTVKRAVAMSVNGKTQYVLQETQAHPDISIFEVIYGTRTLPQELAEALQAKGDLT